MAGLIWPYIRSHACYISRLSPLSLACATSALVVQNYAYVHAEAATFGLDVSTEWLEYLPSSFVLRAGYTACC